MRLLFQAVLARQDLGTYLNIVMAPQPRGLSGPNDIRNTRRRLETFSSRDDEHARRAPLATVPIVNC